MTSYGGPEVLKLVDLPEPEAADGRIRIEVTPLPFVPGIEAVGRTSDGRRVLALVGHGGYAEVAVAPAAASIDLPDEIEDGPALALVLQGLTAYHALRTSALLQPGETVVVNAAAGGVGTLAVQLAKRFGARRVIASASTPEKRQLTLGLGADVAIDSSADDLASEIREANGGHRVDVVLEMIGGSAFKAGLEALAPFGRLVTYGAASRELAKPVAPATLMMGSRAIVGFMATDCFRRPGMFANAVKEMLDLVITGQLRPIIGARYPLSAARTAHEDLRARKTTGKLVLDPSA
jgi:NADPH2:quinone reductase